MMISVCIPTYRGEKRLKRLLPTLATAADADVELLVLDDGSPSEEATKIAALISAFDGIKRKQITWSRNNGIVAAYDQLVRQAEGEVVLFLDDDVLVPFGLFRVIRQLIEIPGIGALSWRSTGSNPGQSKRPRPGLLQLATQLAGYCMAFRREVYNEVGGVDTRFRQYCGDSDLALRMTLAGYPSYRVWWPLVPHEEHGAFNDAPELGDEAREQAASKDLRSFFEKWNATGDEMERRAVAGLECR
jgi:GT2 family glycosyltransferase